MWCHYFCMILTWWLMVALDGKRGIAKVIMPHPLEYMDICTQFHSNPSNSWNRLLQFRWKCLTHWTNNWLTHLKLNVSTGTSWSLFNFKLLFPFYPSCCHDTHTIWMKMRYFLLVQRKWSKWSRQYTSFLYSRRAPVHFNAQFTLHWFNTLCTLAQRYEWTWRRIFFTLLFTIYYYLGTTEKPATAW